MRALFVMFMAGAMASGSVPVWIDTDPSVARGGHEVDDGFALIQAFHSSALMVRGVSVVFGTLRSSRASPLRNIWSRTSGRPRCPS